MGIGGPSGEEICSLTTPPIRIPEYDLPFVFYLRFDGSGNLMRPSMVVPRFPPDPVLGPLSKYTPASPSSKPHAPRDAMIRALCSGFVAASRR